MPYSGIDDRVTLNKNFEGFFYKLYAIKPRSVILERGEDSLKFAPFSPLTPHISHDASGSE